MRPELTLDEFFGPHEESRRLFDAVRAAVDDVLGETDVSVTRSQVAFRRRTGFAYVWRPAQYLDRGAPLVLTIGLRRRDTSARWKEVAEPHPGRFTHHLELYSEADIDDEVRGWLREAWETAA